MPSKNLMPPYSNKTISDFFDFECKNQPKSQYLLNWIIDNFPDLRCVVMYSLPMFKLEKNNICYLQYISL